MGEEVGMRDCKDWYWYRNSNRYMYYSHRDYRTFVWWSVAHPPLLFSRKQSECAVKYLAENLNF